MNKVLYDLTNPQKSIWLTEQFYSDSCVNNICGTTTINELVDFEKLKQALNIFVKDNDSFRIRLIKDSSGDIKQYITEFSEFDIDIINVSDNKDLLNLEGQLVSTKFDLVDCPLFSFKIFKFDNGHGGFITTAHHLIADACTAGLLASKVINIYYSLTKNSTLTEIPTSYINYINSEKEYLSSDKFLKDKEYWDSALDTIPEIGTIPSSHSSSNNIVSAKRKTFVFNREVIDSINNYCKENKISIFNFFMAVYAVYISKVSNLEDFALGTPILNRTTFTEKNTPGMFISTVPFRFKINSDMKFIDFVKNIAFDTLSMFRHQKYPYQNILEHIREKNPSQPNLYDILISYQNTRTNKNSAEVPYEVRWTFNNNVADSMQIHLFDMNDEGILNIAYDYRISKFDDKDITNIHNRICFIIKQVLEGATSIKDIDIATPEEQDMILNKFNNIHLEYDKNISLCNLIEEQCKKTPNFTAITFNNKSISYAELNARANQLARKMLALGLHRHSIIGIMLPRSLEVLVCMLASWKIGACYIPIDPHFPKNRIDYMLSNSNANLLLCFDDSSDFKNTLNVAFNNSSVYSGDSSNLDIKNLPTDPAYIIYTSGSTGTPKGVMLNQMALSNLTAYLNSYVDFLKNDYGNMSVASVTTISFDIFIFETLICLQKGLNVVLSTEDEQVTPALLDELIKKHNIKAIQMTPSRMQIFIDNKKIMPNLANLKYITLAGEALPDKLLSQILKLGDITVYNGYGPSETTVFATFTDVTHYRKVNIGRPLPNTQIYILDKDLNPCPVGVSGELYIAGDGVGIGYINNEKVTNERFLDNTFNPGQKYYRTGDLGKYLPNGEICYIGRVDNQIKIRGLRIELGEIEKWISRFPNINKVIVTPKEDSTGRIFLVAYLITSSNISTSNLRSYLANYLPRYMMPQYFVVLDSLPYLPNGKVDKNNLPLPNISCVNKNVAFTAPRHSIDLTLITILKKLLNMSNISICDNFFDLGGDSLTAISFCSKISNKFNVNITIKDIFENPTIKELSDLISSKSKNIENLKVEHISKKDYYNVSSAQKRIYYSAKMAGDKTTVYNMPGCVIFNQAPNIQKLNECFNKLILRHTSLRTYFELIDGELVQKVEESVSFNITQVDKSDVNSKDIDSIFDNFIKPFNMSCAPLFRCFFITLQDRYVLLLDMHHIIADGLSLSILTRELCKLYNGEELEPLEFNYLDYSNFEHKNLQNDYYKDSKEFWLNQYKNNLPVLDLPLDKPRPAVQSFEGKKIFKKTSVALASQIEALAKAENVSTFMFLLACYYILLSKYSSQENIVIGTPVVGRDKSEFFDVIGMFVNTLPLHNKVSSSATFSEFLDAVKNNCIDSFNNQMYPLDQLVSDLNITHDPSRNPLFDVLFVYQNKGREPVNFGGIDAEYYIPDSNISKFDLSLEVVPSGKKFKLMFEFCTKLFKVSTIEQLANHYINILEQVTKNINIKIKDISIATREEKDLILNKFNDTHLEYDKSILLCNLIEEQCKKTPDFTAITFNNKSISYAELNNRANQLARKMLALGLHRHSIIGIMLPRSLEVLVCMLASWKIGACYIPIDPHFPKNRIDYMLSNSNADLLLCFDNSSDFKNTLDVSFDNSSVYSGDSSNLDIKNLPTDPAYIIYTSGSTGTPKGVMLNQMALSNLTAYLNSYVDFLKNDYGNMSVASVTTISFDIFIFETLICLQKGLNVVLSTEDEQVTPALLDELIKKHNIKAIQMTPSRMQIFIDNKKIMPNLANLKYITLAGEALPDKLLSQILKLGDITVYNGYGPSETTVFATFTDVTHYRKVNIGRPIPNTKIYILDKDLNPCPVGVPGELYIAGDGVGIGYINNEKVTNERFLDNIFNPGQKYYRTGDLGKYLPNGEICYIGRVDNQIKIRGLRIELGEIEKWISRFPNINKVIVTPKHDDTGRTFLIAYLVVTDRISVSNLRSYLSNYLPKYMVPQYFVVLDSLPYLPNGKVDKNSLPLPNISVFNKNSDYVPPRNKLEQEIANIFEKILGVTSVGIHDNFFDLGGDSLLAMNVQVALMKISNNITYSDIFMYPTVQSLAAKLNSYLSTNNHKDTEYDFSKINKVLANNCIFPDEIENTKVGNILITGVTGFLGMHILDAYLSKYHNKKIYCIIRDEPGLSPKKKLLSRLHFYFGNKYDDLIDSKIIIITGDITSSNFGLDENAAQEIANNISCIINSAAKVSHYGNYADFKKINVDGTNNVIEFCKKYNKKLYHVSTISVSGNTLATGSYTKQNIKEDIIFKEDNLFIGQNLDNVYVKSKFEAEKLVLNACADGLKAYILRIGNLMPRFSDGKFQTNSSENAYMNRLLSFSKLGCIPDYLLDNYAEFTPVDYCANAIIKIMAHSTDSNRIFHIFNNNNVTVKDLINIFKEISPIEVVSNEEFKNKINLILNKNNSNDILSGILSDFDKNKNLVYTSNIHIDADFSSKYLEDIGFSWPTITKDYLLMLLKTFIMEDEHAC